MHKNSSFGTDEFEAAQTKCADTLKIAYEHYITELKKKISSLSKCAKRWLNRKAKLSSIPPLRNDSGDWCLDPVPKANVLAKTFEGKYALPSDVEDQYVAPPSTYQQEFVAVRVRDTFKYLRSLDVNTATGPDKLPARVLKILAAVLALPIAVLCRRMLYEACWP